MRILVYGINYAPELTGIGKYTGEMCAWLARKGHQITVITAMPYYPAWKVEKEYRRKWWHKETKDGVRLYRCPLYVPGKTTAFRRIMHELSFLISVFPVWLLTLIQKKHEAVICITPPFHLGFYAFLYSRIRRSKLVTHVQDLQVDAAKNLGMIKNRFFLKLMFRAEKFLLKKSTAVSTISAGMQKKIAAKGVPVSKIISLPNWADIHTIKPLSKEHSLRHEWGLKPEDKVVLYSGNLGEKQGLENIIEAAKYFKQRKDVYFLFAGNGAARQKLEKMTLEASLSNIKFFPLQPYEKLPALLATADVHLVLEKKSASDLVMPSKLVSILAGGGCSIVTAVPGSSLYAVIADHQTGLLAEPENANDLKRAIELALETNLFFYRHNARQYAEQFLSREDILNNWEKKLKQL